MIHRCYRYPDTSTFRQMKNGTQKSIMEHQNVINCFASAVEHSFDNCSSGAWSSPCNTLYVRWIYFNFNNTSSQRNTVAMFWTFAYSVRECVLNNRILVHVRIQFVNEWNCDTSDRNHGCQSILYRFSIQTKYEFAGNFLSNEILHFSLKFSCSNIRTLKHKGSICLALFRINSENRYSRQVQKPDLCHSLYAGRWLHGPLPPKLTERTRHWRPNCN